MSTITLNSNIASLNAQRRLGQSTASLSKSFERLSSGLRVNKASDDAAGLSVAASLNVDARVFVQGLKNINDGISYLNIAESATSSLKDILIRMRELATQSSNGTLSNTQRQALDGENQALIGEYNRIVQTTSFNAIEVFSPSNAELDIQAGYGTSAILPVRLGSSSSTTTSTTSGDGTFQPRQTFAAGTVPNLGDIEPADINGDGKVDLVATDDSTVRVLGNGDGAFQPEQLFTSGSSITAVAIGDFNGDGKRDLATADSGNNAVGILLGNGDGTFQARQGWSTGNQPGDVQVADLNGDGKHDLLTADKNASKVSIRLGNGDGTFQARQSFVTGTFPTALAIRDFNGDGKPDVVTADRIDDTVSVLLGNGDGTFQARQSFEAYRSPISVSVGDFDGDGKPDIAVDCYLNNTLNILLGNGDGTFQAGQALAIGSYSSQLRTADLNGDGKLDLVTADNGDNVLSLFFGNGDGTFQGRQTLSTGSSPAAVAIADFNGDGALDLADTDTGDATVSVFLANVLQTSTTTGGNTTAIGTINNISVLTQAAALDAQETIDGYLDQVNAVAGRIGAAMSRFESAADNLRVGSENFSEARSRIVDADVAEESANLVKGRILQQAGAAVVAQANQSPALALQLLSGAG